MSTTFDVYTSTMNIPTFDEILLLSNQYLLEFLVRHGVHSKYTIGVVVRKNKTNDLVEVELAKQATWASDEYAWFVIDGQPGGCDAYVNEIDELRCECWEGEFKLNERAKKIEKQMRECIDVGFFWSFRRSMGQPAIINLLYGLIAAAFGELTKGFVFSDDGAWDYDMFPITADGFLKNYFNSNYSKPDYADWAKRCIDTIKNMADGV